MGEEETYLAWPDMRWKIFGEVKTVSVDQEELCRASVQSSITLFPGGDLRGRCFSSLSDLDYFTEMEDCMQTCPKLQESRSPLMENATDVSRINEKLVELNFDPDKAGAYYARALGETIWVSLSNRSAGL